MATNATKAGRVAVYSAVATYTPPPMSSAVRVPYRWIRPPELIPARTKPAEPVKKVRPMVAWSTP